MANPLMKKGAASVNPSGRPAAALEFQARARVLVDELVLDCWEAEIRKGGDDWLRASELLTAYAYGKPPQSIEVKADVTSKSAHAELPLEELLAVARAQIEKEKAK